MTHTARLARLLLAMVLCAAVPAPAVTLAAQDSSAARTSMLRVFLDCEECDNDFVRNETRWAEFVRDRTVADVHVLVTDIGTGGGGDEFTIVLVGIGRFAGRTDTLRYLSRPTQTSSERRDGLTRTIQLGLGAYAARAGLAPRLRLSLTGDDDEDDKGERTNNANDPWKAWVFEVGVNGSIEREQRQRRTEVGGSFQATRVTSRWKSGLELDAEQSRSRFELDDRTVTSTRENFSGDAIMVRSLGPHWAAGWQVSVGSSSFANTQRAFRTAPAIEYSLWSYDQATRRQLTLQYSLGVSSFAYREETIFDKLRETRPTQALVAGYDVTQRWGTADATLQYSNYLDDRKQFRLEFEASLDLRIARGLELELDANASQIRDQLSIAKRGASDDEILLELRDLRTDYRFSARIGLSFTFGSIFNSVVNPRFGGGPGQVLR